MNTHNRIGVDNISARADDPVRASMNVLRRIFAGALTLLTGRPCSGQRPIRFTPSMHLAGAMVSLIGGLAISASAVAAAGWWLVLLLPGWAMTLHGMRNLRTMIFHQCAHRNMWGHRRLDRSLGRVIAAVLLVQQFDRYSAEHARDHHSVHHMTMRDPTVQAFLFTLELRPGMSRRTMWRTVLRKLFSPTFHGRFLVARVRSYFQPAKTGERVTALTTLAVLLVLAFWFEGWRYLLIAWLPPWTLFFQISNTLRLCVKHTFPVAGLTEPRGRAYFASLTNAIFLGERAPLPELRWPTKPVRWACWWFRMAFVHFPARYLVLTGDTVCHDFHHRFPMTPEWPNYIFAREREQVAGHQGWPEYRHIWGLVPAINAVFDSLSAADPVEYDPARLAEVNRRELFMAFDD